VLVTLEMPFKTPLNQNTTTEEGTTLGKSSVGKSDFDDGLDIPTHLHERAGVYKPVEMARIAARLGNSDAGKVEDRASLPLPLVSGPKAAAEKRKAIKEWAEDDKPREKFATKGRGSLSDAELLAIMIGSGTAADSALDLARKLLTLTDGNLEAFFKLDWRDLTAIRGIGPARAITICAALELGRRRKIEKDQEGAPQDAPKALITGHRVYAALSPYMHDLVEEQVWLILLTRKFLPISIKQIGQGGLNSVVLDTKTVFREALLGRASNVIVAHNHPSGVVHPSPQDDSVTANLVIVGKAMDCPLADHLIYTNTGFFSYADSGRL
jgi:DNA repair protein RadC